MQKKKQYVGISITAVVTGSFVGGILSFKFHFTLILCYIDTVVSIIGKLF